MTSSHEIINAHPTLLRVSGTIDGQDQFDKAWMANREGRQFPFLESTSDGSDSDREPSMAAIENDALKHVAGHVRKLLSEVIESI